MKIILNNPNPTSSLRLLPGEDVYCNVSILTLSTFSLSVFTLLHVIIQRSEFIIDSSRDHVKRFRSTVAQLIVAC